MVITEIFAHLKQFCETNKLDFTFKGDCISDKTGENVMFGYKDLLCYYVSRKDLDQKHANFNDPNVINMLESILLNYVN